MEIKTVVENAWLTVVARFAIFFASFIALPVAGWMMVRAANSIDTVIEATTNIKLKLVELDAMRRQRDEEVGAINRELVDHEDRIRKVETKLYAISPFSRP